MTRNLQSLLVVALIGFLLSSCQSPETPQQVAEHFWQAVIGDNAEEVVRYSTLVNVKDYNRFSKNWTEFKPNLGKITIENDVASVVSQFTPSADTGLKERKLVTYLVMQNEEWKIDYQKTRDAMEKKKTKGLFGRLNQIGKDLQEQLGNSAGEFGTEVERLGEKLKQLSDQVESDASEGVEKFADELEKSLKELKESIDRSLKDDRKPSEQNKLQET